jgi:hypothetical protein
MAKPLPTAAEVAAKWSARAAGATAEYKQNAARADWAGPAGTQGAVNYKTEVIKAANEGRYGAGVRKAGNAKYVAGINEKGDRYGSGVTTAGAINNMSSGMQPVLGDIQTALTQLPARGPRGAATNYDRSRKVGETLNKGRVNRLTGGR